MRFLVFYMTDCPQIVGNPLTSMIGRNVRQQWFGFLSKHDFRQFVALTGLYADSALESAIVFRDDHQAESFCMAYVLPIPQVRKRKLDERDWQRVRRAVINVFGKK
jgi:hypothetical protein